MKIMKRNRDKICCIKNLFYAHNMSNNNNVHAAR